MQINIPEVHGELVDLFPAYETALVENDDETPTQIFWYSHYAMRFESPKTSTCPSTPTP